MKNQDQQPDKRNTGAQPEKGAGVYGNKNPQSSPTSGSSIGKAPGQSGKDQGSSSFGQQTGGNYGQTPDARKGSISDKGSLSGQKEGRVPSNERDDQQQKQQDKDLEKLRDPDKTKGPERSDIDPVSRQHKGLSDDQNSSKK